MEFLSGLGLWRRCIAVSLIVAALLLWAAMHEDVMAQESPASEASGILRVPTLIVPLAPWFDEGVGTARIPLSISHVIDEDVSFSYRTTTANVRGVERAIPGRDYRSTQGTVTIKAGSRNSYIDVEIIDDANRELASGDVFRMEFSDPVNVKLREGVYGCIHCR